MRSVKFNADMILDKSYQLFNKGGSEDLKIKKVAQACHCSVIPIYYSFKSKKCLYHAVLKVAFGQFDKDLYQEIIHHKTEIRIHGPYRYICVALSHQPGLIKEIHSNTKQIINGLAIISKKYFPNYSLITLRASLLLVCSVSDNSSVKKSDALLSPYLEPVIENLLKNLETQSLDI